MSCNCFAVCTKCVDEVWAFGAYLILVSIRLVVLLLELHGSDADVGYDVH